MPIASTSGQPLNQEQQAKFNLKFGNFANNDINNVQSLHELDKDRIRDFKAWCNSHKIDVDIEVACDKLKSQYKWFYRSIVIFIQIMDEVEN